VHETESTAGDNLDRADGAAEEVRARLEDERWEVLARLEAWLETPMLVLGFLWLALLVVELTRGLTPVLDAAGTAIWIVFILDFAVKFALAPRKLDYLRSNWLTALSLAVPALRVFRVVRVARAFRAARAVRGIRLFRLISSLNRGMKALSATMGRRGFGYVVALSTVVLLAGSAGMLAFESGAGGERGLDSYGEALWWTAMLMTTLGSEYWPQTGEGRMLCLVIALYSFAVFGYVTATIATFFLGRDAESEEGEVAGERSIEALRAEIAALREEVRALGNSQR
jgi:voltage-gated potassium channel